MTKGLRKVSIEEATDEQLLEFGRTAQLEVRGGMKRSELVEALTVGGFATTGVFVPEDRVSLHAEGLQGRQDDAWDPARERWAKVKFALDDGENRKTPVFVSVNDCQAYLPRGVVILIRERLYRHVVSTYDQRYEQAVDRHGVATTHLSASQLLDYDRYPMRFYGYFGLVRDGRPPGHEGVVLIDDGASLAAAAKATQKAARDFRAG